VISAVRVRNFRSLRDVRIVDVGKFTVFAGRNGTGKSNILRALNLFFNNQVEEGIQLDLSRDVTRSSSRSRQEVRIAVKFDLPSEFTFHRSIRDRAATAFGGSSFWLARIWSRETATRQVVDHFESSSDGDRWEAFKDRDLAQTLLSTLIKFRYVANHVHPVHLIEIERANLQRQLVKRLRSGGQTAAGSNLAPLRQIAAAANTIVAPVAVEIGSAAPELGGVRLSTPSDWADVALSLNVELEKEAEATSVELHGSGHQSLLAYCLLHLLDSDYSQSFGWRQATIWAIEEPESFLHQELAVHLSQLLHGYARSPRFALFATSHSPAVMAFADIGGLVVGDVEMLPPRELIVRAAQAGASPYTHHLLAGAPKPLLVVEGKLDVAHLTAAYKVLDRVNPFEIREVLDVVGEQGESAMGHLLRYHGQTLAARPLAAPVVLLLDQDVKTGKVEALRKELSLLHPSSAVVQTDRAWCTQGLDVGDFGGIEGLLSIALVEAADAELQHTAVTRDGSGEISLKRNNATWKPKDAMKAKLGELGPQRLDQDDYKNFTPLLNELDRVLLNAAA